MEWYRDGQEAFLIYRLKIIQSSHLYALSVHFKQVCLKRQYVCAGL